MTVDELETAKAYLCQLKTLNDLINDMQEDSEKILAQITKITPTLQLVAVSGGGSKDTLGDGIVKLVALQKEIDAEVNKCVELKKEIRAVISSVKNDKYRTVLRKRYVLFKTWEQIACEMGCTYQWVNILDKRARRVVAKIISQKNLNS